MRCCSAMEWEIENYFLEHPTDLGIEKWVARQFHVPSGVIDLLGVNSDPFGEMLYVVELKAITIKSAALTQVYKYATDIYDAISYHKNIDFSDVQKIVVGYGNPSYSLLIEARAMGIRVYTYDILKKNGERFMKLSGPHKILYSPERNQKMERLANSKVIRETYADRIDWRL